MFLVGWEAWRTGDEAIIHMLHGDEGVVRFLRCHTPCSYFSFVSGGRRRSMAQERSLKKKRGLIESEKH